MSGVGGTLACGLFAVPVLSSNLATGTKGLVYGGGFHQLGVQALGLVAVGAFAFGTSYSCLWVLNKLWGIRVDPAVEVDGLDVHEHGMWGYPEFYIPVPGGYGTQSHGHLGTGGHSHAPTPVHTMQANPATPPSPVTSP
jgi:Amt family ammonium transporter